MHPRNRHTGHYDFKELIKAYPHLTAFVSLSPRGESTIDFANPDAVKALNVALLKHFYGVTEWDIPSGYLCPPIPGRADYLHHLADLLGEINEGVIPRGHSIRVLDIGVGANCIYPIIGRCEYGWSFVGSDIDAVALASAKKIVQDNKDLLNAPEGAIELRLQTSPNDILDGLIGKDERFDVSICNPPFHASLAEAQAGSRRKWNNLGVKDHGSKNSKQAPKLNFGGQSSELWCTGGEVAFVRRMIEQSKAYAKNFFCFSTLISKEDNLPAIFTALEKARVTESGVLEMTQGQKKSRAVAWSFLDHQQQKEWREKRWTG
jgi:23S rRNA (adenine1618-N6)-methyltransferase